MAPISASKLAKFRAVGLGKGEGEGYIQVNELAAFVLHDSRCRDWRIEVV